MSSEISYTHKTPIAIMIGGGSKLPKIIKAAKNRSSKFKISLVISHKKESEGIELVLKNNIPATYFNLVYWLKKTGKSRADYMKYLGWFISQPVYAPKILVFAGWNLVVDNNFLDFLKCDFGSGYAAVNLHPALLPVKREGSKIKLPDGTYSPIIRGEQEDALKKVIDQKLTYFGPTVHFMVPTKYDTGEVVNREFIKVGQSKNIEDLRKKLLPAEDKILIKSINEVVDQYL